jgi:hypothetical protein
MGKFITLREEFESETGSHPFADQRYIEWLEKLVERQREVKNCSIPAVVGQSEQYCDCKCLVKWKATNNGRLCECGKIIKSH